jgi:hypothetical protein
MALVKGIEPRYSCVAQTAWAIRIAVVMKDSRYQEASPQIGWGWWTALLRWGYGHTKQVRSATIPALL